MGLDPEHPNYEPGIECPLCVDLLFNGLTPKYVEADIFGIDQCPAMDPVPGDSTVLLTQDIACRWIHDGPPWSFVWELTPGQSLFTVTWAMQFAFQRIVADNCIDAFVNANDHCGFPVAGINGYVTCWWGPTIGP
ncbi:hypothetical protein ES703_107744 [subsurface metagenome]